MKKLIIGRGNDCDIVIPDDSDLVSRHHAELIFDFWGKMQIVDTSSNGTFLNGVRLAKGQPMEVRRTDNVSFAKKWEFDWETVKDPYAKQRPMTIAGISLGALALLGLLGWAIWFFGIRKSPDAVGAKADSTEVVSDSASVFTGVDASKQQTTPSPANKADKADKKKKVNTPAPKTNNTPNTQKSQSQPATKKQSDTSVNKDKKDNGPGVNNSNSKDNLHDIKERDTKKSNQGYNL